MLPKTHSDRYSRPHLKGNVGSMWEQPLDSLDQQAQNAKSPANTGPNAMGDTGLEPRWGARVGFYPPCLLGLGDLRFAEICSKRNLKWNLDTIRRS